MIQTIALAVIFIALAAAAFVASVRLGMLLGLRLDRIIEARASGGAQEELAPVDPAPSSAPQKPIADGKRGREEYRGD
jgi:hypothetical protein